MIDVPPPPPQELDVAPVEIVETVDVQRDIDKLEYEVVLNESTSVCQSEAEEEVKTVAGEDDFLTYAQELRSVFDDGFQWSDLSSIARLSIEFMQQFTEMTENEKRDGVVSVMEYLIDITDTPYLPDFITDPIMKVLVPPFVDLMISVTQGEVWSKGADRYGHNESVATPEEVNAFFEELKPVLQADFAWSNFFQAFEDSLEFFCSFFDMSLETKKDAIYSVLAFIIDETSWPFFLDPILDPILKAILPPVIDLVLDQIAG